VISKNDLKLVRSLKQKKFREKMGLFLLEGKRVLETASESNTTLSRIFYTPAFSAGKENKSLLEKLGAILAAEEITEQEMKFISPSVTPPGLLALAHIPAYNFSAVSNTCNWVYLDGVSDPGNMGTLLRTTAWFGIYTVGLDRNCIDAYNPKVVRAAMGAHFYLKFMGELNLKQMKNTHILLGADQRGSDSIKLPLGKPFVLMLGNEAHGLSAEAKKEIDLLLSIKKYGQGESLNVAAAAGVLLDRIVRRE